MKRNYVHGYDQREGVRLQDQAQTLERLLHFDTSYPDGHSVLEIGCGIGAQTIPLARNSPGAHIVSVDISAESIAEAKSRAEAAGVKNVRFEQADIFALPFAPASFDHVFVCFVLEHLSRPIEALAALKKLLRPRGTITVIEGDHGSAYFHPDSSAAHAAIRCLIELQRVAGGNALIGRQLYPLLLEAGFELVRVSPRLVYVDSSKPALVDGFTRKTFTAMIEGVREPSIKAGLAKPELFDAGIKALYRTAENDGVFCYTFFKALAEKRTIGASPAHTRPQRPLVAEGILDSFGESSRVDWRPEAVLELPSPVRVEATLNADWIGINTMAGKASKKSAKVAKKAAAKRVAKPVLLAGGNPQIAKADGDVPVQAYIAAMPGWKRDIGRRLDALIMRTVPDVRKAVKWNSPFYGIEGQGWFLSFHCFTKYVKVTFFSGTSLRPLPPGESKHEEVRYLDIHEDDQLDGAQLAAWVKQASQLAGWGKA